MSPRPIRVCSTLDCGRQHEAHGYCRTCLAARSKVKKLHPANPEARRTVGYTAPSEAVAPLEAGHTYQLRWRIGFREHEAEAVVLSVEDRIYAIRERSSLQRRFVHHDKIISAKEVEDVA